MRTSTQLAMEDPSDPSGAIPEILLPVQFVELFQRSSGRMPELALMAAVLEDAILSFCRCADSRGVRSQQLFQETAEWFESHDVTWLFAFENILRRTRPRTGVDPRAAPSLARNRPERVDFGRPRGREVW